MNCGHDPATWQAADGTCDYCNYFGPVPTELATFPTLQEHYAKRHHNQPGRKPNDHIPQTPSSTPANSHTSSSGSGHTDPS